MRQKNNEKGICAVVDFQLAFCEELFTSLSEQFFCEGHIMRKDPILSFHFSQLVDRLQELTLANDCTDYSVVLLERFPDL